MVDNAPFLSCQHAGLTIEGYSRAAVQSYWRIPELKIGFDLGAQPWDFMGTPTWFVTHTHLDHVAALPVYVARRRMMKMEPPTIYLPGLRRRGHPPAACSSCSGSTAAGWSATSTASKPGHEIELSRDHVVTAFATTHTIPSLGYLVWERRRQAQGRIPRPAGRPDPRPAPVGRGGDARNAHSSRGLHRRHQPGGPGQLPARVRGQGPHHRDELHPPQPSPGEDPQVRPHAPRRLPGARRPVQERADHLRHFSTRYHPQEVRRYVEDHLPESLRERVRIWL